MDIRTLVGVGLVAFGIGFCVGNVVQLEYDKKVFEEHNEKNIAQWTFDVCRVAGISYKQIDESTKQLWMKYGLI